MSRIFKHVDFSKETTKEIFIQPIELTQQNEEPIDLADVINRKEQILNEARLTAQEISEEAQRQYSETLKQIEQLKEDFQTEKEQIINEVRQSAFQTGLEEGRESGYLEYTGHLAQANQIIEQSKEAFASHVESSEKTILELAVRVAERILNQQLENHEESFIPIVKNALKEMSDFKEIQIHVHPNQYQVLAGQKDEIDAVLQRDTKSFIYANEDVEEFTCMIESEKGKIDATVSTQLIEIKNKLMELLESDNE